ncbi:MAG TPA: dephospho-CoA kinase [Terriglobia bacterium]|nr:dephospho-CoA kinase [Terriglobia bacterium]
MLRVGLTGGLGSGKSTVAEMLRDLGAEVIEADDLGRRLMEPGETVYAEIVRTFGQTVVAADGRLDRARLAELAFRGGRLAELNSIVHPAVIEAQRCWMNEVFRRNPHAVAVVVSALIFEVVRDARARGERESVLADWRRRIDRIVVVTAPDEVKIARYIGRMGLSAAGKAAAEADARSRLRHQISDELKAAKADYVIENRGDIAGLRNQVEALWHRLQPESNKPAQNESLK